MNWTLDTHSIVAPQDFVGSAVAAGIKKENGKLDLGLIFSTRPAVTAARFTSNVVKAAPLLVCLKNLKESGGAIRAIIVNSGNANACTGENGLAVAEKMAILAGRLLAIPPREVLVSSTGVIGLQIPFERMERKAAELKENLGPQGVEAVAAAIMTTDTVRKVCSATSSMGGSTVRITGMTKGAGMIHPRMATTLGFVLTDAAISRDLLEAALTHACERSYNRISVDGDTSTNDTLAVVANGASGAESVEKKDRLFDHFVEGLTAVCQSLAQQIVRDGEGATKFVEIAVTTAPGEPEATAIARSIANSPLVKTALAGEDANWGRILCAAGYSGVSFDPSRVDIWIGDLPVCRGGVGLPFDESRAKQILRSRDIQIRLDLNQGQASSIMWTCDLTKEYIHINADYRT
ncbi:MAG: bifunctional glutamate N-acetyltransferase/amino-acid acetyltransferase ArgJ [Acidobacteriota bacterium]